MDKYLKLTYELGYPRFVIELLVSCFLLLGNLLSVTLAKLVGVMLSSSALW